MAAVRKLRFGVVGLTSDHVWDMGDGLAGLPGVEIVAASDGYPELRERAAKQWNTEHTYDSHDDLLDAAKPDAILVCCDNAGKSAVVQSAAQRGVHVYQDKPMAATLEQAQQSAAAAQKAGISLMVAFHRAFDPVYAEVNSVLDSGALGALYLARGVIGHVGPVEFGCSKYFSEWLFDPEKNGGGCFIDEGCYLVDSFVDQLGPVAEVSAFTTQMGVRDYLPPGIEDNAVATLRFRNGALGLLDVKWGQIGPAPVLTSYHGTTGTLSNPPGRWELYSTAEVVTPPDGWQPVEAAASAGLHGPISNGLRGWRREAPRHRSAGRGGSEQEWFVDRIRSGEPIDGAVGIEVALHTQAVIEAAYESAGSGCAVAVQGAKV
jgi:predicted dehydrogenase